MIDSFKDNIWIHRGTGMIRLGYFSGVWFIIKCENGEYYYPPYPRDWDFWSEI